MPVERKKGVKKDLTPDDKAAMGQMAGKTARQATIEACNKAGLTVEKVAQTVVAALDAHVVKAQLDPRGEWAVSEPFTDHVTRLKAVDSAIVLLDLKPAIKAEVGLNTMTDEDLDRHLKNLLEH